MKTTNGIKTAAILGIAPVLLLSACQTAPVAQYDPYPPVGYPASGYYYGPVSGGPTINIAGSYQNGGWGNWGGGGRGWGGGGPGWGNGGCGGGGWNGGGWGGGGRGGWNGGGGGGWRR